MDTLYTIILILTCINVLMIYAIIDFHIDNKNFKKRLDTSERDYFKLYEKVTQLDNELFDLKMDIKTNDN